MSFERPVQGDSLRVESQVNSAGRSVLFATAKIFDSQENECARCQGVVRISQLAWKSGESPAI
jgi:acyl-coenzyme A thioesterase PaaI-like protein